MKPIVSKYSKCFLDLDCFITSILHNILNGFYLKKYGKSSEGSLRLGVYIAVNFFNFESELSTNFLSELNYEDFICLHRTVLHNTSTVNDVASILQEITQSHVKRGGKVRINWKYVSSQIEKSYGRDKFSSNIKEFHFILHSFFLDRSFSVIGKEQNNIYAEFMKRMCTKLKYKELMFNFEDLFREFPLSFDTIRSMESFCCDENFEAGIIVSRCIFMAKTLNLYAKYMSAALGGGKRGRPKETSICSNRNVVNGFCELRNDDKKRLEAFGKILIQNPKKYSSVLDATSFEILKHPNDEFLKLLLNLGFSNKIENLKKNSVAKLESYFQIIIELLSHRESKSFLKQIFEKRSMLGVELPKHFLLNDEKENMNEAKKVKTSYRSIKLDECNEGAGMYNTRENCFIISSLQALFHLKSFVVKLLQFNLNEAQSEYERVLREIFSQTHLKMPVHIDSLIQIIQTDTLMDEVKLNNITTNTIVQSDAVIFQDLLLKRLHVDLQANFKTDIWIGAFFICTVSVDINEILKGNTVEQLIELNIREQFNDNTLASPNCLIIRIERFIFKSLEIDRSEINVEKKITIRNRAYNLRSIICHHGQSMLKGHYTTYAKSLKSDEFYLFNDDKVLKKNPFNVTNNLMRSSCVCLMYEAYELNAQEKSLEIIFHENTNKIGQLDVQKRSKIEMKKEYDKQRLTDIREKNPQFVIDQNLRRRTEMTQKRKDDPEFLEKDRQRLIDYKNDLRLHEDFLEQDRQRVRTEMTQKRKNDPEFLEKDRQRVIDYKKDLRLNEDFLEQDRQRVRTEMTQKRKDDPEFLEKDRQRVIDYKKDLRLNEDFLEQDRQRVRTEMTQKRKDNPEFLEKDRQRVIDYKKDLRLNEDFLEQDRQRVRTEMTQKRKDDPEFLEKDRQRVIDYKNDLRLNEDFLEQDRQRVRTEMTQKRKDDPEFLEKDRQRVIDYKNDLRLNENFLEIDQKRRRDTINLKRKDDDKREEENARRKDLRLQKKLKLNELKMLVKTTRNDQILQFNNDIREKLEKGNEIDHNYLKIFNMIEEVPSSVCTCCDRLLFPSDMKNFKFDKIFLAKFKSKNFHVTEELLRRNLGIPMTGDFKKENCLCGTCYQTVISGKNPLYGRIDGLKFNIIDEILKSVPDLEERMISPVIPFMQVRELKPFTSNTFDGCKGAVINILIDIHEIVGIFPRKFNEISIHQIMLKRHLVHKTYYKYETVKVKRVLDSIKILKESSIYKDLNIQIDEKAFEDYEIYRTGDHINFISNEKIISDDEKNAIAERRTKIMDHVDRAHLKMQNDILKSQKCPLLNDYFDKEDLLDIENLEYNQNELIEDLLNREDEDEIFGKEGKEQDILVCKLPLNTEIEEFENTLSQEHTNDELKLTVMAPGQNKKPTLAKDIQYYEEKCFPTLYGGEPLNYNRQKISMTKRYKHQIQNKDRRFCVPKHIFLTAKQKLYMQLSSGMSIAVRKKKSRNLTLADVMSAKNINKMCDNDEAYRFMRGITLTPAYSEDKKRNVFGFLRQKGKSSFFMTLSPAESFWSPLLKQLYFNKWSIEISHKKALNLSDGEKYELMRNDPVLCVEYFHRRYRLVLNLLQQFPNKVFGENNVCDYFYRVEYQMRGSPHVHSMIYNSNAPECDIDNSEDFKDIIKFIDNFITTEYDFKNPNINHQIHMCTHTCFKKKNSKLCRFNFPRYPMQNTMILLPFKSKDSENFKKAKENLKIVKEMLDKYRLSLKNFHQSKRKGEAIDYKFILNFDSFDKMLADLKISKQQYIDAIRSDIDMPSIFHKRHPNAIEINNYNTNLLNLWQGNMDLQYVLDPYAAANYLFSYMLKSDSGMIRLLQEAVKESKESHLEQKAALGKIANAFSNSLVIGSAQAADYLLGTAMSKFSRKCVFINTGPKDKRIKILKKNQMLKELDEDETDIFERGLLENYEKRPKEFKNICLADFASEHNVKFKNDIMTVTKIKKDDQSRIIRFVRYDKAKNEHDYYREQLMLYIPYQNEDEELNSKTTLFLKNKYKFEWEHGKLREKYEKYNKISHEQLQKFLEKMKNEEDGEDEEESYQRLIRDQVEEIDAFPIIQNDIQKNSKGSISYAINIPPRISNEKVAELVSKLNVKQRELAYHLYWACVHDELEVDKMIILLGTAGTGKSLLINAIYHMITNYYDKIAGDKSDKDKCKVLLTASTGMAAHLIGGTTYHSAFKLPIGKAVEMSENIASTIRKELKHLELLIIDEISMMSNIDLQLIDSRMQKIFNNNLQFGGKKVLLVGDFLQLGPVRKKPIYFKFINYEDSIQNYQKDLLWESFRMHELNQVMRQKNLRYIEALINLSYGKMTDDDVNFINERKFKEDQVPNTAVRLYYRNMDVSNYNDKRVTELPGEIITIYAKDSVCEKNLKDTEIDKIMKIFENDNDNNLRIPKKLLLKVGVKYMIPSNIDVVDGLVNGAIGILRHMSKDENNEVYMLWLVFSSSTIGRARKLKYSALKRLEKIQEDVVPVGKEAIELIKQNDSKKMLVKNRIIRIQFPLTIAEAITIHKSQGQTFPKVCLDLRQGSLPIDVLFVGLSRTDHDGLYLLGEFKKPRTKGNVEGIKEIERLKKEARLKLCYDTLEDINEGFTIIYQNINSYPAKQKFIAADEWYSRGNVLIFSEANVSFLSSSQIPSELEVVYPKHSDNVTATLHRGLLIFSRKSSKMHIENLEHLTIENRLTFSHIDLKFFTIGNHFIITGYKSPRTKLSDFRSCLQDILTKAPNDKEITIIGDFNFESGKRTSFQEMVLNNLAIPLNKKIQNQFSPKDQTTILGSQIDIVFSSSVNGYAGVYPTYFSDHHAVFYRSTKYQHKKGNLHIDNKKKMFDAVDYRFEEIISDEKGTSIENSNPKSSVELSNFEKNLQMFMFENAFSTSIISKENGNEYLVIKNVENMCCFNSFYHGIMIAYIHQNLFKQYLNESQHIKFFSVFKTIFGEIESSKRNSLWIQFLYDSIEEVREKINSGSMITGSMTVLDALLDKQFFSFHWNCFICGIDRQKRNGQRDGHPFLPISIDNTDNVSISNLINSKMSSYTNSRTKMCNVCGRQTSLVLGNLFIIFLSGTDFKINSMGYAELEFKELVHHISINGVKYKLLFAQHYIPGATGHFVLKYNLNDKDHLHIDDLMMKAEIMPNNLLVNPKLMVFIKCNE